MKIKSYVLGVVVALVVVSATYGQPAPLSLQLSSSDDLTALGVGDMVTVDVSLSGLQPGEELVSLTGSVLYPDPLMGTPLSINPGAIAPNAIDFLDLAFPGQADGSFVTFSPLAAAHITSDGVFYSFDVQAQAVGSGQFALDSLALIAEQHDPSFPILRFPEAGPPLDFSVVPVPAAALLAMMGMGTAVLRLRKQR